MLDYVKPIIGRKPDFLLINPDTIDLSNNVNTMKKVRDLNKCIRNLDRNEEMQSFFKYYL